MGDRGRINATQVEECINIDDIHFARTALVCLENTNNRGGGSIYNAASIVDISKVCKQQHLPLHLDGARIFNALAETGQSPQDAAAPFDSLSVCLSKGLGCPVGSLLLGSYDFIIQAKRVRKVFGGGWRQAGFLAAAGIYALDHHIIRLKEDHAKAKYLGDFLLQQHFVESLLPVETNIVIMNLKPEYSADYILFKLNEAGIKASKINLYSIRFVLHLDITDEMLAHTIEVMKRF
jgi:threonine aldolase